MDGPESSKPDWQLLCEKTRDRLSHLLNTKLWADCTFLVGDEKPVTISAHKFVLAMSSPVFDTMFNGSMPEKCPITVPDIEPEAFNLMLKFMYQDYNSLTLKTYQEASDLYCAARKYMLPFIQKECVKYLNCTITPPKACFAHEFSTLFDEKLLLEAALKIFKRNTKNVLKDDSFCEAHINTVAALFACTELDIDTELDLFNALERYAAEAMGLKKLLRSFKKEKSPAKKPRIEGEVNDNMESSETECDDVTEDEKRLVTEIRQAVAHIRFLTLTPLQFSQVARSILLTNGEALAVMINLAGVATPLPATLSNSRLKRNIRETPKDNVFEAMCLFTVANFKTRKRPVWSKPFSTDRLNWRVNVVPSVEIQPNGVEEKIMGLLVECKSESSAWSCTARVTIELIHLTLQDANLVRTFTDTFNNKSTSNGYRNLLTWSETMKYLRSNVLKVNVRVVASITKQ